MKRLQLPAAVLLAFVLLQANCAAAGEAAGRFRYDASLERAARTEAILALNAGYLFANNRALFGPESERREILRHLRLEDPVLAQISAKAQKAILSMSLGERRKSVTSVGVIR